MNFTPDTVKSIILASELITAGAVIIGLIVSAYRWYLRQGRQDEEIKELKDEQTLICYALLACLDGLEQLGANHSVPIAKNKLEKHLNVMAHK